MVRRLLPVGGTAAIFAMALTASATAALETQRQNAFSAASASFLTFTGGPIRDEASISVQSGETFFGVGTFIRLELRSSQGETVGCFQIPERDASLSPDLSAAAIHTSIDVATTARCAPSPPISQEQVGIQGGGDFSAFRTVQIDVTLNPGGPRSRFRDSGSVNCLDFSSSRESSSTALRAAPAGTITATTFGGATREFASGATIRFGTLSHVQSQSQVQNSPAPDCQLKPPL